MVNVLKHKEKMERNKRVKELEAMGRNPNGTYKRKSYKNMDATITFRCTKEYKAKLKEIANKDGVDMTTLIAHAINTTYESEFK